MSYAWRYTSSYLTLRQRRSTNTLSTQRPLPSMLMATAWALSTFGVMSDWRVGSGEATEGQRFILDRAMLRRVPLSLGAAVGSGQTRRLQTDATVKRVEGTKHKKGSRDRKLSYQLPVGVETEPLYSLDSAEELRKLAARVRAMWAKTNGGT